MCTFIYPHIKISLSLCSELKPGWARLGNDYHCWYRWIVQSVGHYSRSRSIQGSLPACPSVALTGWIFSQWNSLHPLCYSDKQIDHCVCIYCGEWVFFGLYTYLVGHTGCTGVQKDFRALVHGYMYWFSGRLEEMDVDEVSSPYNIMENLLPLFSYIWMICFVLYFSPTVSHPPFFANQAYRHPYTKSILLLHNYRKSGTCTHVSTVLYCLAIHHFNWDLIFLLPMLPLMMRQHL